MSKTVFIVLHYMVEEITNQCVSQLRDTCKEDCYHIVIVDNGSSNSSGQHLAERHAADADVTVLLSDSNLGFAQGNNLGYRYAKDQLNPDYIIFINNDLMIKDSSFCHKIQALYDQQRFAVLGPDIMSVKTGLHQNPVSLVLPTKTDLENKIARGEKALNHFAWHCFSRDAKKLIKTPARSILKELRPKFFKQPDYYKADAILNPVLHGACLIFSRDFFEHEELAFNPNTFLYMEEEILNFYCISKSYPMFYSSAIQVEHFEDVSTDYVFRTRLKKARMQQENQVRSAKVLLNLIINGADDSCN